MVFENLLLFEGEGSSLKRCAGGHDPLPHSLNSVRAGLSTHRHNARKRCGRKLAGRTPSCRSHGQWRRMALLRRGWRELCWPQGRDIALSPVVRDVSLAVHLVRCPPGSAMKCPKCQCENAVTANVCEECSAPLAQACADCGSPMLPQAKFCSECGRPSKVVMAPRFASPKSYTPQHLADKILTTKDALEGERKQVTVLFADIKGSMEIFTDRDPEDVQNLLDPVLEHMMEAVHRYEGTVNRVMGDGIMALFGAPLAHEDHAVRACYAALRMQETVTRYADEVQRSYGVPVTIRVGLNSGEIVIRAIGNDLHMDYAVVGQTANLASRMEQMAKPGTVLTTANTLRLAEGYVAMSPLGGPMPVKGLADLVQIYEVTGVGAARTRLQASARRGLTRFVGRDTEL